MHPSPPGRCASLLTAAVAAILLAAPVHAQPRARPVLDTQDQAFAAAMRQSIGAPARADLDDLATARLEGDLVVIPHAAAARLLTVTQRPVPPDFIALLLGAPGMEALGYVRFIPAGFIDSDAALGWSADDMLDSLRDTVERANRARSLQNRAELEVRRWVRSPKYDPEAHQLSWAALIVPKSAALETDGEITLFALAFGRAGFIQLSVVTSVEQADVVARMADSWLQGLNFVAGHSVRDVMPGDARASGGLAGAMQLDALHKAQGIAGRFWDSDAVVPVAGGIVAATGALSLLIYVQRHLRRRSPRV